MLLGLPHDWQVTPTLDGAAIDTPDGRIVHIAKLPLRRARELAIARLAWRPGAQLGAFESTLTDEGEYAVLATALHGERELAWGFVYADDSAALYELEAPRGTALAPIARVVRAHRFALGIRWRRYRYAPPSGWDALARGLVTDWLAPGFPRAWGVLTVHPAVPASALAIGIAPSIVAAATAQGLTVSDEQPFEPPAVSGLDGLGVEVRGTFGGAPVHLTIGAYLDDRYVYAMELQGRVSALWPTHHAALITALASIDPLPRERAHIGEG